MGLGVLEVSSRIWRSRVRELKGLAGLGVWEFGGV